MPAHFDGSGVAIEEGRERMLESLQLIESLLSEDNCTYPGKYFQLSNLTLTPKPVQKPFSTPRAAANSRETFELMAKLGYPVFAASHINPFSMLKDLITIYKQEFVGSGHNTSTKNSVDLLCPIFVGSSSKAIKSDVQESLDKLKKVALEKITPAVNEQSIPGLNEKIEYLKGMSFEQLNRDMALFENPEMCVTRIEKLKNELNIDRLLCRFNPRGKISHKKVMKAMKLFSEKVIPILMRL